MWDTLKSGKVVPGFGHAVLRKTDPRYMCQVPPPVPVCMCSDMIACRGARCCMVDRLSWVC